MSFKRKTKKYQNNHYSSFRTITYNNSPFKLNKRRQQQNDEYRFMMDVWNCGYTRNGGCKYNEKEINYRKENKQIIIMRRRNNLIKCKWPNFKIFPLFIWLEPFRTQVKYISDRELPSPKNQSLAVQQLIYTKISEREEKHRIIEQLRYHYF